MIQNECPKSIRLAYLLESRWGLSHSSFHKLFHIDRTPKRASKCSSWCARQVDIDDAPVKELLVRVYVDAVLAVPEALQSPQVVLVSAARVRNPVARAHRRHVRLEVAQSNEDGAHLGEVALDHVGGHVQQRPLLRIDVEDELRQLLSGAGGAAMPHA